MIIAMQNKLMSSVTTQMPTCSAMPRSAPSLRVFFTNSSPGIAVSATWMPKVPKVRRPSYSSTHFPGQRE